MISISLWDIQGKFLQPNVNVRPYVRGSKAQHRPQQAISKNKQTRNTIFCIQIKVLHLKKKKEILKKQCHYKKMLITFI